jgi:hypothetical protein
MKNVTSARRIIAALPGTPKNISRTVFETAPIVIVELPQLTASLAK